MFNQFKSFMDFFKSTTLWQAMASTKENSPFHREDSVAIHTEMTINHYLDNFYAFRSDKERLLTLLSLAFHDTGKPGAKEEKFSEARGNYNSFAGHEKVSARIAEDFIVTNWKTIQGYFPDFTEFDFYRVIWMIENHKPWDIKDKEKLQDLRNTIHAIFGDMSNSFYDHLASDAGGRISDSQDQTYRGLEWAKSLDAIAPNLMDPSGTAQVVLLVGASGSGKSTYRAKLENFKAHSLDDLRIQLFASKSGKSDFSYDEAWGYANEHNQDFNSLVNKDYMALLKSGDNIVVDNTNLSRKARRFYATEAKRKGYKVTAVWTPVSRATVKARQQTRADKTVADTIVETQYNALSIPSLGSEVHELVINTSNLA